MSYSFPDLKELSHAYCVVGQNVVGFRDILRLQYDHLGVQFFEYTFDRLLIDDVRIVRDLVSSRRGVGEHHFFVIATSDITHEAQQALLKSVEEPSAGSYIFLHVPDVDWMVPTLRSRFQFVFLDSVSEGSLIDVVSEFCDASIPDRMKLIEKISKKKTYTPVAFIDQLLNHSSVRSDMDVVRNLLELRTHAHHIPGGEKMIFETAAFIV